MLARIRKAVTAGIGGGVVAAGGVLGKAAHLDRETVGQAIGAFIVGAAVVGYATWRTPKNAA